MINSQFVETVAPKFKELLKLKRHFRSIRLDELSPEQLRDKLAQLQTKEREVMSAWAKSTKEINPSMISDVEQGRCNYTLAKESYLRRVL